MYRFEHVAMLLIIEDWIIIFAIPSLGLSYMNSKTTTVRAELGCKLKIKIPYCSRYMLFSKYKHG